MRRGDLAPGILRELPCWRLAVDLVGAVRAERAAGPSGGRGAEPGRRAGSLRRMGRGPESRLVSGVVQRTGGRHHLDEGHSDNGERADPGPDGTRRPHHAPRPSAASTRRAWDWRSLRRWTFDDPILPFPEGLMTLRTNPHFPRQRS